MDGAGLRQIEWALLAAGHQNRTGTKGNGAD